MLTLTAAFMGLMGTAIAALSLGWAFARPARRPYAAPMFVGAVGGVLGAAVLLLA